MPDILVYVSVCNPSSKLYFGITAASLKRRICKHFSYARKGSTQKFHRAIRKYGEGSFTWHLIDSVGTWEEACEAERFLIHTFDTTSDDFGYNMTAGGEGSYGVVPLDSTKRKTASKLKAWHQSNSPQAEALRSKIRALRQGSVAYDETRRKISLTSSKRTLSVESRLKISESKRKYSDEIRSQAISEARITSLHAAERKFGIPRQTISRWLLSPDLLEESRRRSRLQSKRWYQINHLSSCSVIQGPSG